MAPATDAVVHVSQVTIIAEDRVFPLLLETFLVALHAILTLYILRIRWMDRKTSPLMRPFLFIILAMFGLSSGHWALGVYMLQRDIYVLLPQLQDTTPLALAWLHDQPGALYAQQIIGYILIVFGDGVIQWRAYVIYGRPRWLGLFLIFMFVAEAALYVVSTIYAVLSYFPQSHTALLLAKSYGYVWTPLAAATLAITGWTYVSSTALIAFKLWRHRKIVRSYMHRSNLRSFAILAVMVESGVAYIVLWAWYTGVTFSTLTLAQSWLNYYAVPLFAMYPAVINLLVAPRRSIIEKSLHAARVHKVDMHASDTFSSSSAPSDHSRSTRGDEERGVARDADSDGSTVRKVGSVPKSGPGSFHGVEKRAIDLPAIGDERFDGAERGLLG
ncbi:unnamed protein product [Peniophora sp. CBMAI 1063]|nr:unnamed protein product [Peniophora sp. CBMAI 1063]